MDDFVQSSIWNSVCVYVYVHVNVMKWRNRNHRTHTSTRRMSRKFDGDLRTFFSIDRQWNSQQCLLLSTVDTVVVAVAADIDIIVSVPSMALLPAANDNDILSQHQLSIIGINNRIKSDTLFINLRIDCKTPRRLGALFSTSAIKRIRALQSFTNKHYTL